MSTDSFRSELMASLLSQLPAGLSADDVTLVIDENARTVRVTVDHLVEAGTNAASVSSVFEQSSFTSTVAAAVGTSTVEMSRSPVVEMKVAPVPSPPPTLQDGGFQFGQNQAQTGGEDSRLSDEMIWVIIVAVIFALLLFGCVYAYYRGRRSALQMAEVKAQAAAVTAANHAAANHAAANNATANNAVASAASSSSRAHTPVHVPSSPSVEDAMRLVQFGVELERQRSGSQMSQHIPEGLSHQQPISRPIEPLALEAALQNVQVAPGNPQAVRNSQNLWLTDAMASVVSSPRSTPLGSADATPKGAGSDHV